jgi:hypothetical protein
LLAFFYLYYIFIANILNLFYQFSTYKSGFIADTGQTEAQVPHPAHFVLSIWHFPPKASTIAIAGHTVIQV